MSLEEFEKSRTMSRSIDETARVYCSRFGGVDRLYHIEIIEGNGRFLKWDAKGSRREDLKGDLRKKR